MDVRAGDLIVSLRSSSSLVILDKDDGLIKHIIYGPMVAQHSPDMLPDGDVLVFDNLGWRTPERGSRIMRIDLATGDTSTVFPVEANSEGHDFFSEAQGTVHASSDGTRILVSETLKGRVFEVDIATDNILWTYEMVADMGPYLKEQRIKTLKSMALLNAQGADYVDRVMFTSTFGNMH